jgi:hypothetical protein
MTPSSTLFMQYSIAGRWVTMQRYTGSTTEFLHCMYLFLRSVSEQVLHLACALYVLCL